MSLQPSPTTDQDQMVCCLLTASGRGAVAVVALAGEQQQLVAALDRLFKPIGSRGFNQISQQPIVYGEWLSTREDLVVCTTPLGFEIQCHGGDAASAAIIDDLKHLGVSILPASDWRIRSTSIWRSETEQALCNAITERTADILLNLLQLQDEALQNLAAIDDSSTKQTTIQQMLRWSSFGQHLTRPRSVVFCGHPNVGKSSLVNAIVGFDRAIVNEKAGTTRDVIAQTTAIDGWPVSLTDTAGLRDTAGEIEKLGIEKAQRAIQEADVRIAVFDATKPFTEADRHMIETLNADLVLFNKIDLAENHISTNHHGAALPRPIPTLNVSALDRTGLAQLMTSIAGVLVPELPPLDQWYPVTENQTRMLQSMAAKTASETGTNQNQD